MEMTGEYRLEAPREAIWQALNDPEVLKRCIPGCQELNKESDTAFTAKVRAKVGPVSASFAGKVQLSDLDPPNGYRISGEGQGGAAGFAKGGATVSLTDDGGATRLSYEASGQVGGKLAQIGSRLIDGTAKKMADQFFGNFAKEFAAPEAAAPEVAQPSEAPSAAEQEEMAQAAMRGAALGHTPPETAGVSAGAAKKPTGRGLSPAIWVTALVVVAGLLLLIFAVE